MTIRVFVVAMAAVWVLLAALLVAFPCSRCDPASPEDQIEAIKGLILRLLGESYVEKFSLEMISPTSQGRDVFEIESSGTDQSGVLY